MKIETVDADRIGEVLPLIRLYQTFYQVAKRLQANGWGDHGPGKG